MTKFKVGDKVRCVKVGEFIYKDSKIHGFGWELGREFIIEKISNNNGRQIQNALEIPIYWSSGCFEAGGVYEHALELIFKYQKDIKVYGIVNFMK